MPAISRRSFVLGSCATGLLVACGGDDDGSTTGSTLPASTAAPTTSGATPVLGSTFDRNALLVGGIPQRAPFVLFESTGGLVPIDAAPDELTFELEAQAGPSPAPVAVRRHGDDVGRGYWPVVTTFPSTGLHAARVDVGGTVLELAFNVNGPGVVSVPQVGEPLPSAPTPTTADPLDTQTICTRQPACPFHQVSLDDALASGAPIALLVSTPAFCQVAICGPVLDLLVDRAPAHPDVVVVHLEVYPYGAPPAAPPSPVVPETLGMTYEPGLFVADARGVVTARLDSIYDGPELDDALSGATA
jgi:hypothetical protein